METHRAYPVPPLVTLPDHYESRHIIDCNAEPTMPPGHSGRIFHHEQHGIITWDPSRVSFFQTASQRLGYRINGRILKVLLSGLPTMNMCALNYFLKFPSALPEEVFYFSEEETWLHDTAEVLEFKKRYPDRNRVVAKEPIREKRHIAFWGTSYTAPDAREHILYLCLVGKNVEAYSRPIDVMWSDDFVAITYW